MKGLIYNTLFGFPEKQDFFMALGYILIMILFFSQPEATALLLFWGVCNFSLSTGARLQSEKLSGWDRYELTLPVNKSQIIRAKYLSFFTLLIKNTVGMLILFPFVALIEGDSLFEYAVIAILFGIAVSLLFGASIHPLYLMQKYVDSSELMFSAFMGVFIVLFLIWIIIQARDVSIPLISYPTAIVSVGASVVLYIISCFLSVFYYQNKQR